VEAPDVDQITAANLKRLRSALGRMWSQETLANEVRTRLGLEWTRDLVAAIERGQRRLSVGEVLALAHLFRVSLSEFFAADDWVALAPGLRAKGLAEICVGDRLKETEDSADRLLADYRGASTQAQPATQAEQKAARALDVSLATLRLKAKQRWGRSFDEERDQRVQELQATEIEQGGLGLTRRGVQALRGHVARELYAELQSSRAKQAARTKAAQEPNKSSRKGSRKPKTDRTMR
jgi:hypothetical protein